MFFAALPRADRALAVAWWALVVLRGLLPAYFAVAVGVLVRAVGAETPLGWPLAQLGVIFVLLQITTPIHTALSYNLGDRMSAYLYDRLTETCTRPSGLGHLEDASLAADLTVSRDFDLGMTGPPLSYSMDFIAGGLVGLVGGLASASLLFGFRWWAPLVLVGVWLGTHWLLRESAVWFDRQTDAVKSAQRDADYAYRLAVDPPASKEVRLFGLASWLLEWFVARRTRLHQLQFEATRLRERPLALSVILVTAGNLLVLWALVSAAARGELGVPELVVFAQAVVGASLIAFGGFDWALDGASAPVAAVDRLGPAMRAAGDLPSGTRTADRLPVNEIRFRNLRFAYPDGTVVLDGFDLTIPAGSSLAIVGQNGAGKTTLAKLLCRMYDPVAGAIEVDGVDLRALDLGSWREQLAAVFQDFVRFEWPLRDNVAPHAATGDDRDATIAAALGDAGAADLARLDTVLGRGYTGGIDLSGGQWQRVALARALYRVKAGARVVVLDEPTAQLDVKGETQIFERLLAATRHCTVVLISHRFQTVRRADRICVLEHGKVIELGTHDELMALGGRYRTMFDAQAQRFDVEDAETDEEGRRYDVLS